MRSTEIHVPPHVCMCVRAKYKANYVAINTYWLFIVDMMLSIATLSCFIPTMEHWDCSNSIWSH